jgi:hypothetical protein
MSILGGTEGFLESAFDVLLFAYTDEEIAEDGHYREWREKFPDLEIPGLSEGIRLKCDRNRYPFLPPGNSEGKWDYLTIFGVGGDKQRMAEAVSLRREEGDSAFWLYEAIGPLRSKAWREEDREEHVFMALANAVPGREEEFHEWYDHRHIPDILSVDVYRSARRFKIIAASGAGAPWSFLSLYRYVGPAGEMPKRLHEAIITNKFEFSDAFALDAASWIYSAI